MISSDNSGAAMAPQAAFAKALSQKDALWRVFFAVNGSIALTIALGDGGFFHTFAFDEGRHDTEFHTAWICGLALGLFAAVFDRMVGASDHLRQRPITAAQLFWHRQRTMGGVVLTWFVAAPIAGWIWMAITLRTVVFEPMGVISAWASFVPAMSAAAIGYFGASLPVRWWLRPFVVAAAFLGTFTLIHQATLGEDFHVRWAFVSLHLLAAALFVGVARLACGVEHDPDGELPGTVRFTAVPLTVVAFAFATSGVLVAGACEFASQLWREYPQVARYQDQIRLVDFHHDWRSGSSRLCDRDHQRLDAVARDELEEVNVMNPSYRLRQPLGFWEPRWHRGVDSEWASGHAVYLTHEGEAFVSRVPRRATHPTGIGPEHGSFSPGSRIRSFGVRDERILVLDGKTNEFYVFDEQQGYFVPLPLPHGDRVVRYGDGFVRYVRGDVPRNLVELFGARQPSGRSAGFVQGEKSAYLLSQGAWVAIELPNAPERQQGRPWIEPGEGWLEATVTVPAAGDQAEFSHHFSPRTLTECALAALATAFVLVLPPPMVVQFSWPLAMLTLGLALLWGGVAARRVRRLGGAPADRQLWLWLTVLLGPLGALLSLVFVRPRTYRERPRLAAAPTPRVFTPIMKELAS